MSGIDFSLWFCKGHRLKSMPLFVASYLLRGRGLNKKHLLTLDAYSFQLFHRTLMLFQLLARLAKFSL